MELLVLLGQKAYSPKQLSEVAQPVNFYSLDLKCPLQNPMHLEGDWVIGHCTHQWIHSWMSLVTEFTVRSVSLAM